MIHVVACRISGAERQKALGHSIPQQKWNGVANAVLNGAKVVLAVVQTASAKPRQRRPIFDALVRLVDEGRVHSWWASSADRVTRRPRAGCELVEAIQDSGTRLMIAGGGAFSSVATDPLSVLMLIITFTMNSMHGGWRRARKTPTTGRIW